MVETNLVWPRNVVHFQLVCMVFASKKMITFSRTYLKSNMTVVASALEICFSAISLIQNDVLDNQPYPIRY